MAQRLIHDLLGEKISGQIRLNNKERFLLGSVLPDAAPATHRDAAHFKIKTESHVFYDFEAFRNCFQENILRDDLYLGYYLHLVEDVLYRAFLYQDRIHMPRTREDVERLHQDYRLLNAYIVEKYGLCNTLGNVALPPDEPLFAIAPFTPGAFLVDMASDFSVRAQGSPVFFTKSMLDQFVETSLPLLVEEAERIREGTSALRARDYAWLRKR